MPKLWSASTALAVHFGYNRSHEVLITVIYNLLDSGKDLLLGLPFGLYSTFVVEQRHGFNKQSLGLFIKDQVIAVCSAHQHCNMSTEIQIEIQLGHVQHVYLLLLPLQILVRPCSGIDKLVSIYANLATVLQAGSCIQHASLLYAKLFRQTQKASCIDGSSCKLQIGLGIVLLPPLIAAITLILKNTGPLVAIYLWFFILVVSIFMMTIYPVAIAPLFNKFTPLPEGSLRYACYQTFLVTS